MDLRHVECFVAVARHLHFGRAAEELHLAQTTVSDSIARLERELGGQLFTRTTRRVELTALGETFLADAVVGYESLRRAYERAIAISHSAQSELAIGYCHDEERRVVLGLVAALQRQHGHVSVDFQALSAAKMIDGLHRRAIDIAMCYVPVLDDHLAAAPVASSPLVALVRNGHPFSRRAGLTLAEVATEPLVLLERTGNPNLYDRVVLEFDHTGVPWRLAAAVSGIANLAARALAGDGIGIAVAAAVPDSPVDGVECVPIDDAPSIEKFVVWRRDDEREIVHDLVEMLLAAFLKRRQAARSRDHLTQIPMPALDERRVG